MSHPDEGVLQELLDGELAPGEAAAVRAHLAGCVPCAEALRELGAMEHEADAIVSRLDLDPPLRRPAPATRPGPRVNLRVLGLAASTVLVAGTSWLLLRSSPDRTASFTERADTESQTVPSLAQEDRGQDAARPPSVPPAAVRRAETGEQRQKPKEAQRMKQQAEKKERDAEAPPVVTDARPANATPPMAGLIAPAPASRLAAGAAKATAVTPATFADAEARLGTRVLTISGLAPVSVDIFPISSDSPPTVRQRYMVDGVPVVLVQRRALDGDASGLAARDEVTAKLPAAEAPRDQPPAFMRSRSWQSGGILLELEGALPADSLEALMRRVR